MSRRSVFIAVLVLGVTMFGAAEDQQEAKPVELAVLKALVGVWDAEIEVWPEGPDKPSITFFGVETNRAYGEYWIASDFDSEFGGQTLKVHSIVGYDLERKQLVGTIIDHGPYAASMTGEYDESSNTVRWTTKATHPNGTPMLQKTTVTQSHADERVLELSVPEQNAGTQKTSMRITFVRRK